MSLWFAIGAIGKNAPSQRRTQTERPEVKPADACLFWREEDASDAAEGPKADGEPPSPRKSE
jgi:hypothetical protein